MQMKESKPIIKEVNLCRSTAELGIVRIPGANGNIVPEENP